MLNKNKDNFSYEEMESQRQVPSCQVKSRRLSLKAAIAKAKTQIDINGFRVSDRGMANEIISIIAEIYMLDDSTQIKIAGDMLDAYTVKQVFEELREDHVQLVIDNYSKVTYIINYKKSYIRTALYNAVFEFEAHYTNLVNCDMSSKCFIE